MSYSVEYKITQDNLQIVSQSIWECRNLGLNKIVDNIYNRLRDNDLIKKSFNLKINCHDLPINKTNSSSTIEFDCSTTSLDDKDIFPDYVFGNWWHIGLEDYDNFVNEIVKNSDQQITDHHMFWIGNLQNIPQRIKYVELSKQYPEYLLSSVMYWTDSGRKPTHFIPIKDLSKFKYLIDLAGFGCSGRLKLLAYCNRPFFISDRNYYSWSDIEIIKQNLHVPINNDLSDLISQIDKANQNYNIFVDNAKNLQHFVINNLSFKNACDYAFGLLVNKLQENNYV